MPWLYLSIAAAFEITWAIALKASRGMTILLPASVTVVAYVASLVFLAFAVRSLPISTAYAVWTGIGAAGTAIIGMVVLDEPRDAARVVCIALIVAGTVGLKFASRS